MLPLHPKLEKAISALVPRGYHYKSRLFKKLEGELPELQIRSELTGSGSAPPEKSGSESDSSEKLGPDTIFSLKVIRKFFF